VVSPLKAVWDYNVNVLTTLAEKTGILNEVTNDHSEAQKTLKEQIEGTSSAARTQTEIFKGLGEITFDFDSWEAGVDKWDKEQKRKSKEVSDHFRRVWGNAISDVSGDFAAQYNRRAMLAEKMARHELQQAKEVAEKRKEIWEADRQAAAQAVGGISSAWTTAFQNIISGQQEASEAIIAAVIHSAEVAIQAAAASGAAQAAFSQAGIPILGPALAVATSALIFGLIRGFLAEIPKAAQGGIITGGTPGTDSVPMMTMPGERILSVEDNAKLIRAVERGSRNITVVFNSTMPPTDAQAMRAARHLSKQLGRAGRYR
jgi:hypothetical protein